MLSKQRIFSCNIHSITAIALGLALLFTTFIMSSTAHAANNSAVSYAGQPVHCEHYHYVQQGEHIASIAAYYGVDYYDIATYNNLPYPFYLSVGQRLCINGGTLPMSQAPTAYQSPAPHSPQAPQSPLPTPTPQAPPAYQSPAPQGHTMPNASQHRPPAHQQGNYGCSYVVTRGDMLSRIARHYGVSMRALARANNIHNANHIYVGQRLMVPCIK